MYEFASIIIPVLNGEKYINTCLKTIINLDYPKDNLETILVDNGSSDNTVEIAKKYDVRILVDKNRTISHLRNLAATFAKGEILAFIDVDCIVPKNWLKDAVALLSKKNIGAVGCWYRLPSEASWLEKSWDVHMGNRRARDGDISWVPSGNFIISKKIFNQIGGFNQFLITGEDVDICERIHKAGYEVFSQNNISVVHIGNPKNLKDFFIKQYWHGKGGLQMLLRNFPQLEFNRVIVFALITLLFLICTITAAFIWKINGHKIWFIISVICLISFPLAMSIKAIIRSRRYSSLFSLLLLFLIFGISRAISLVDINIWKNNINKFKAVKMNA